MEGARPLKDNIYKVGFGKVPGPESPVSLYLASGETNIGMAFGGPLIIREDVL